MQTGSMKNVTAGYNRVEQTKRERPKPAPYLVVKNIQGTAIGDIWKKFNCKKMQGGTL